MVRAGPQELCRQGKVQVAASESVLASPEGLAVFGSWLYVSGLEASAIVQVGEGPGACSAACQPGGPGSSRGRPAEPPRRPLMMMMLTLMLVPARRCSWPSWRRALAVLVAAARKGRATAVWCRRTTWRGTTPTPKTAWGPAACC